MRADRHHHLPMSLLRSAKKTRTAKDADRWRVVRPHGVATVLCVLSLSACSLLTERVVSVKPDPNNFGHEYPDDFAAAGRKIAQEQCASCHAVERSTRSPDPRAPPFDTLLLRQDPERIADNLLAGNRVGHDGMPRFDFNVIAADSLMAYLEALNHDTGER